MQSRLAVRLDTGLASRRYSVVAMFVALAIAVAELAAAEWRIGLTRTLRSESAVMVAGYLAVLRSDGGR